MLLRIIFMRMNFDDFIKVNISYFLIVNGNNIGTILLDDENPIFINLIFAI